jgi:hypothetical protein
VEKLTHGGGFLTGELGDVYDVTFGLDDECAHSERT